MYKLSAKQIKNLSKIDIAGPGGRDVMLANAMGHERASSKFYDAIEAGNLFEYKKQQSMQWIDGFKLACLDEAEEGIVILWFNHREGKIVSIYSSTYEQVQEALFPTKEDKSILIAYREVSNKRTRRIADQLKVNITVKEIEANFTLIWRR